MNVTCWLIPGMLANGRGLYGQGKFRKLAGRTHSTWTGRPYSLCSSPNTTASAKYNSFSSMIGRGVTAPGRVKYHVRPGDNVSEAMTDFINDNDQELIIIGASHEWRIRYALFGSIPVIVAGHARCSVLMARRYLMER